MTTPESPVPAKVEPKHLELADELINSHVDASHSMRSAAQLIADSEAAATAELRGEVARLNKIAVSFEFTVAGWDALQSKLTAAEAQVQELMKDHLRLEYLISHIYYADGMLCEFTEFAHQMDAHNGNVRKAIDAAKP